MKIWWFKRLKDDKYIDFTSEATAGRLFKDRNFDRKYEYIGWSDGTKFDEVMAGHLVQYDGLSHNEELAALQNEPEVKRKRKALIKEARIAELRMAEANPDKKLPVYEPIYTSGKPHERAEITRLLKTRG